MIRVDDVRKTFGKIRALDGVSLTIEAGERVAIVGTNGSGKTTLLRAMCGLLRVEGTIRIGGVDVAERPEVALQSLAYVPQVVPPLDAPVNDLVRAWCGLRGRPMSACVERAARLKLDLVAIGKTRVRDLSGGMKQKLLASLALTAESPILVCDEPTANLDVAARETFFADVLERPKEAVLVLCSHRADEVRHLVHRVIELRDGRVVSDTQLVSAELGRGGMQVAPILRRVS